MVAQNKLYTVEEFERFADSDENSERRFELIDGEIIEKVPTELHGVIVAKIVARILIFVEQHGLGRVAVEPRHRKVDDNHNARLPDIAFTSKGRALPLVEKGSVPQLPDLAIEVKSPDDTYTKMRNKAAYYIANGCLMVWLIFPEKKLVEIYQPGVDVQILDEDDIIDGASVLPDFKLAVRDIFPKE